MHGRPEGTEINNRMKLTAGYVGTYLMIRRHLLDFVANERCLPLSTHDDAVLREALELAAVLEPDGA